MGLLTLVSAQAIQANFNSLGSSSIALQAQQYASAKADIIKATSYNKLEPQSKTAIQNSNSFYDAVELSPEESYSDEIKQRTATIHVYLREEFTPRFTLKVVRTSTDIRTDLPVGSIIPWFGKLINLPEGWQVCDGTKGTPDLRDRFIVGVGSNYKLGDTGGANEVTLKANEQSSHYHFFGWNSSNNTGYFLSFGNAKYWPALASGVHAQKWNGSNGGNWSQSRTGENLATSLAVGTDAEEAHENRPPYYALFYIMRIEA